MKPMPFNPKMRFSLFSLLLLIGVIATLLLPVSYYVRSRMAIPEYDEMVLVNLGSVIPNSSSIYQNLLSDPAISNLQSIRRSSDPNRWLQNHILLAKYDNNGPIVFPHENGETSLRIDVVGNDADRGELSKLIPATIEILRDNAKKTHTSISIMYNSKSLFR